MIRKGRLLGLCGVLCSVALCLVYAQETTAPVEQWLAEHAIPIKTVEPGTGFADLEPLKNVLKSVRIVGLGEATHGSREFFQFKHRMLAFLASEMHFRVFTMEASHAACENINEYILYGKGDPAKALASLGFWTWDTEEVSAMIEWMRSFNSKVEESERIRFYGFDIQHNEPAFATVSEYLKRTAPEHLPEAEAAFRPLRLSDRQLLGFSKRSDSERAAEMARLRDLASFLKSHQDSFVRKTSSAEFDRVVEATRIIIQFDDAYSSPLVDSQNPDESLNAKRDRYMAENFQSLLGREKPDARVVVWAHNGHIAAGPGSGMGSYLRKSFGDAYYAFGFTFDHGAFQSRELLTKDLGTGAGIGALREFKIGPAPEGSVGWYFERARRDRPFRNYIVDFRGAGREGPVAEWLSSPHPMFSAGGVFSSEWTARQSIGRVILRDEFDGLIFIEETTRARPNPTGMRGPLFSDRG